MRSAVRRLVRNIVRIAVSIVFGGFVTMLTIYVLEARAMPDLTVWHEDVLPDEYDASDSDATFDGYLEREQELFDELERLTHEHGRTGIAARYDRFSPGSYSNPAGRGHDWNRTFILRPAEPRGAALLVHGLTDSPYSLRAVGRVLERLGFYVVGLRVPGHGTAPGALTRIRSEDWEAALELAVGHTAGVAEEIGPDAPFIMGGYSNGAALVVDYTLEVVVEQDRPVPDRLILLSPALTVSRLAALARVQLWLSRIPGLHKLAWTDILPEYDPYKYNSFPVNAGRQIFRLTAKIHERVQALTPQQKHRFPPVLSFGSVVDATVPPTSALDLARVVGDDRSEVVMFDINRRTEAADFIRTTSLAYLGPLLTAGDLPYGLTLVTNVGEGTLETKATTKAAGTSRWDDEPLPTPWPGDIYSLSHVAVPFRSDDPVYGGDPAAAPVRPYPKIGSFVARGERGITGIPMDLAMRLRFNPFFGYMQKRIERAVR